MLCIEWCDRMPSVDRVPLLEAEVLILKHLVQELQERVCALEAQTEFEFVEEKPATPKASRGAAGSSAAPLLPVEIAQPIASSQSVDRLRTLQKIGRWVRQALNGNRKGTSGREVLKEPTSFYLVARVFAGRDLQPAVVCTDWASAARIVKLKGQLGQSLCIGLPSREDCEVVAVWAGLELPAHDGHGDSH